MSNHHPNGNKRSREWSPVDLSAKKRSRIYLDSHKDVEKRRRDRINSYLETIRELLPIYNHLPKQKRIDKADVLDMTVVYLKTVNSFLQNLGVKDVFCAIHQRLTLLNSSEKWIQSNAERFDSVPSFVYGLSKHLQSELRQTTNLLAESVGNEAESQSDRKEFLPWPYLLNSTSEAGPVKGCCSKRDDKMWEAAHKSVMERQNPEVNVGLAVEIPSNSIQTPFKRQDEYTASAFALEKRDSPDADNTDTPVKILTREMLGHFKKPAKEKEVLYCLPKETSGVMTSGYSDQCGKISQPSTSNGDNSSRIKRCHCDLKILVRDQGVNTEQTKNNGSPRKEVTMTVNAGKIELDIASLLSQAQEGNCVVPVTFQGQVHLGVGDPCEGEVPQVVNSSVDKEGFDET